MDRQKGDCEFLSQDDKGCYFNQEIQGLTFCTQAQNFDKIVSVYMYSTRDHKIENGWNVIVWEAL